MGTYPTKHMTEDTESSFGAIAKTLIVGGGLLAFLIAGFWFWRPWWHWLVYGLTVKYPGVLQWMIIGGVLVSIALAWILLSNLDDDDTSEEESSRRRSRRTRDDNSLDVSRGQQLLLGLGVVVFVGGLLFGGVVGSVYTNTHMAETTNNEVTDIDELPETDAENARILPYEVGYEYSKNSLQYPRHHLEGGDITYINGTPHWSYALAPDGTINSLWATEQQGGVYANMSTSGNDVSVQEQQFDKGQGMAVWRNYEWQLKKDNYFVDYQDPMMVPHEGEQYIVTPYIEHDREFRLTPVPQMYSVPEFGGVAIMDADGNIEHVAADDTQDHPVLEDQRVYPYDLAQFEVESTRYQHGAINKWFYHEDELELAPAPGEGNDQPFTVTTEDGIKYFTAAEPWGDASGIYQVWVHDGQTGEMERLQVDVSSAMVGPNAATEYVMTNIDRQGLAPVEPVPLVRDGTLYWQVKVLPDDGRGIAVTAFVNAENSDDITMVETDSDIRAFLKANGSVEEADLGDESDVSGDSGSTMVITIEHADGTTEDIVVEEGSTITIESDD